MLRAVKKEKAATAMCLDPCNGMRSVVNIHVFGVSDVTWSDGTHKSTEVDISEPAPKRQKTNPSDTSGKVRD